MPPVVVVGVPLGAAKRADGREARLRVAADRRGVVDRRVDGQPVMAALGEEVLGDEPHGRRAPAAVAVAVADDRPAALADELGLLAADRGERGARPLEAAVTEHEPLDVAGAGHGHLEVADGGERRGKLGRRVGVERVGLRLDRAARTPVRPSGEALGH